MKRTFPLSTVSVLSVLISLAGSIACAGATLDATGSGFYGLSEISGPYGRASLSPQVTFDSATSTKIVSLPASANHHEAVPGSNGFDYVVALSGHGSVTYGAFTSSTSFNLQAEPESVTNSSTTVFNIGHSELEAHLKLTINDSGVVTSSTLALGKPVQVRFIVISRSTAAISEPETEANGNPYSNGNFAGLSANGFLNLFDENSQASVDDAVFLENHITVVPINSAVGNRVDLTAVYSPSATGYAGLDGQSVGLSPFYPTVDGTFNGAAHVYVVGPVGVSFSADSQHDYAPDSTVPRMLGNISTRGFVGMGNDVMIGGFIITGTAPKQVILRALGPTLGQPPFNIAGALADPVVELHAADGSLIISNNNWMSAPNASQVSASGYAPPNVAESAILTTLNPGSYTAIVRGAGNLTGVALVECYDLGDNTDSELGNVSTRSYVDTGNKVMIAGLIVKGPANEHVIIRGLGPTLGQAPFNVPNTLADPFLDLRDANGNRIIANNNWADTQAAQIQASGYAPPNTKESAIDVTLVPGNYTAILSGVNNTAGNALVEVYALN